MNKNNYLKLFFLLILLSGTFFGCLNNDSQYSAPTTGGNSPEVNNPELENLNKTTISKFYEKELKFGLNNGFLAKLKEPAGKSENNTSINLNFPHTKLEEMKTIVTNFRVSDLTKIENAEDKKKAEEIIKRIDDNLAQMSDKVLVPLKDGLTKDAVEKVQRNLEFFQAQGIPEDQYGSFGLKTYEAIEKFLNNKLTELDKDIEELNAMINSNKVSDTDDEVNLSIPTIQERLAEIEEEVKQTKQENKFFKLISIASMIIALISIIVPVSKKSLDRLSKFIRSISSMIRTLILIIVAALKKCIDRLSKLIRFNKSNESQNNQNDNYSQNINKSQQNSTSRLKYIESATPLNYWIPVSLRQEGGRHSSSRTFILEENPQGNYIVYKERNTEYLSINQNIRIDENNYEEISSLFQCSNYNPNCSHTFQVRQSAVVNTINSGQSWQLQNRGILQLTPIQAPPTNGITVSEPPTNGITVSETEQSESDRRLGKSKIVVLEPKRRGNYLVYKDSGYECLVPSKNLKVNKYNYKTIEALFECNNYNPNHSNDFQVVQPAILNSISSGETWELQQRGILQF
ncbi:hypothetical protein [Crocosphaera sp.]|uniref:hypothetical protein n=1 Tax=Crocosphaera sp. TaxID=2729996 RepID=UPI00262E2C8D|nr:hypothetical protein [Crocosphaera sp.]MDJ0581743.1 hypothetical protein [Crocosphaera sp.]